MLHATINRTVKIKNASKRMSNYSSCLFILTQLIGFELNDNGEKITLPDDVEIDTLIDFRNFVQDISKSNNMNDNTNFNDDLPSYEMKMIENNDTIDRQNASFWACNYCTYHNPIDLRTCQMCAIPRNGPVCVIHHMQTCHRHKIILRFCDLFASYIIIIPSKIETVLNDLK